MGVSEAELRRHLRSIDNRLAIVKPAPGGLLHARWTGRRDMILDLLGEGRQQLTVDEAHVMYDLGQDEIPGYDDKTFHGQ